MSIALVTQYLKDTVALNEVFKQRSLSTDLEAPKVQFVGADSVKLPKISFGAGLGSYSRANGHTANALTLGWDLYTLTQDKGNALKLDAMDDEEGLSQAIIPFINEYIRTLVVPAVDTYRFGKIAAGAGTIVYSQTVAVADVIAKFQAALQALAEAEVPTEGNILYITPAVDTLLQTSADLSKFIQVGAFNGNVDLQVRMFNGNKIVVVPASRLGSGVNFLLVNPDSVMAVIKHNPASFFAQGSIPGFDGSEVDYRLYHDLFVIAQKNKGVYVSVTGVDPAGVKLTFNLQGGNVAGEEANVMKQGVVGEAIISYAPTAVKEGFTLTGWSLTMDGAVLTTEKVVAATPKTLYAIWEE